MAIALLIVYGLLLSFILLFSVVQLQLTWAYLRKRHHVRMMPPPIFGKRPLVTVQLPLYNERHVVERLIDQVAQMDWPRDRFEVQVLDDSTDETTRLAAERVAHWQAQGIDITHVRRPDRTGFKAGALAYGTERAKGELIAVFDADFLPPADLLQAVAPWFNDPRIGMVQTCWGHINRDSNLLTRLQAFGLDAHFSVEQVGRNTMGRFINFNGTAGVWRKACITDAGGWRPDTLTEDLDLSYRAQLKGWQFHYLESVVSPAELPAAMNALKTQQYRWNKGAAECVVKNLPSVLRDPSLSVPTKVHALFHLMNSTVFVCILGTALLSVPVLLVKQSHPELHMLFNLAILFTFALLVLVVFYWIAHRKDMPGWRGTLRFLWTFPLFLSVSMGLSLHNAIAVLEGYAGRRTPFLRTPKLGGSGGGQAIRHDGYWKSAISPVTVLEGAIAAYAVWGIAIGFRTGDLGLLPYHIMLALGFGLVCWYSVAHSLRTAA
ncbi:MAG: glycosyltransferase family 2 protein [Flavobacteriales bacterium]|jgi:cellulose synthase/poly-beta-1,6-N-acetylglucosamine synthase-like glycosyltransferase|nr:glycosyltransferase family 2 protein [Flavobacteriales bacterium]MCB0758736.1 glycosyltransferase family 2 protein [Flavobacteriales bacterium]